jgi:hypothetical protein
MGEAYMGMPGGFQSNTRRNSTAAMRRHGSAR